MMSFLSQFYTEAAEAESWMKEKIPQLTSSDLGRDEDSVLVSFVLLRTGHLLHWYKS